MTIMSDKNDQAKSELERQEKWTEEQRQSRHKIRMRFDYRDLIEDIIQDGQERGVFDNLRGKGQPLRLYSNPYEGESQLANSLMKEHNLLPAWLQRRNAVLETVEQLRETIALRWQRHAQAYHYAQDDGRRLALSLSWDDACRQLLVEIGEINKLIDEHNLRRPSESMEIYKLRLADELRRVGAAQSLGD